MSRIYSDENQIPSLSNESKKRQSCPAQLPQNSFGSSSQILGDSTNMRRSFVDNQKNIFFTQQKESVSSRFSEPVYSQSELKSSSLASKSLLRSSLVRNDVIEEESSQIKSSSLIRNSQILKEESHLSNSQLSQESSISKRSSTSSSKERLSHSSQKSGELLSSDTDRATTSCPKKTLSVVQKIVYLAGISLVVFLFVILGKFLIGKATGQSVLESYFIEDQQIKNKYFESQIFGQQKDSPFKESLVESQKINTNSVQMPEESIKNRKEEESNDEEWYQAPKQIETNYESRELNEQASQKQFQNTQQLSQSKQEMLIQDESEQFFSKLVQVVQREAKIPYSQFEEYLDENCTAAIKDKVKAKIQRMVDESLSIKEELDISTGARFYVSQEKYY